MYGIAVEYLPQGAGFLWQGGAVAYRAVMVRQPGYRRRLALRGADWCRSVDLFLFTGPDKARAALASNDWRACVAAHPICLRATPALLVDECPLGGSVILLCSSAEPPSGDQARRRDHLVNAEPAAVLW